MFGSTMAASRKIQPAEWDAFKPEIETSYLEDIQTLEQLIKSMQEKHGFSARSVITGSL
jgi:hypothetical protein